METSSGIRDFFRQHRASAVEDTILPTDQPGDPEPPEQCDLDVEVAPEKWSPITPSEAPIKADECPRRFIDGSHVGHTVISVRAPGIGCVVPMMLAEVGGVAINSEDRQLVRDFFGLERV